MAGTRGHSGGANRLTLTEHQARGTLRPARHAALLVPPPAAPPVSVADRRRVLAELPPVGRRLAVHLLDQYTDWDAAGLATLRSYALSTARLAALEAAQQAAEATGDTAFDAGPLYREIRANLALLKQLDLERPR